MIYGSGESCKSHQRPGDRGRRAGSPLRTRLRGDRAALAGKPWVAHYGTLTDLDVTQPGRLASDLSRAIKSRWFGAVILHPNDPLVNMTELRQFYEERAFPEIHSPFLRRTFNIELGAIFIRKSLTPS
jgi:hypothetical protein